ncbi:MAG: PHP domain-containing protein, partial [Vampirovibrionia bacterium]
IGQQELKDVLSTLNKQDYSIGKVSENVKNGVFKANFHIHTDESDGMVTVEELLDQAVSYADKMKNPPFYFSITNHDLFEDNIKALELISQNPTKYSKIRFIPGIEIMNFYNKPDTFKEPVVIEILSYGLNPFSKHFKAFFDDMEKINIDYAKVIVDKANKLGLEVNFDKLAEDNRYTHYCSNLNLLRRYLRQEAEEKGVKREQIDDLFTDHIKKYGSILVSKASVTMEQVGEAFKDTFLSLAHPGRYGFYNPDDSSTKDCLPKSIKIYPLKDGKTPEQALVKFISDFKNIGGQALEMHYPYDLRYNDIENNSWMQILHKTAELSGLLNSGGLDTHRDSILYY